MKKISKYCRIAMLSAAVAAGVASCADHDITGGNNNGNINGPLDPVEAYPRAFVKEFGEFKAQKWSEAVSGVISVRTSKPTPVNVFADIDGRRFIFASFGALNGLQPIMVHIPDGVEELIVEANGMEYKTKLGEVLDLTEGSRYAVDTEYVTGDIDNFKIQLKGKIRKIKFGGTKFRDNWLRYNSSDAAGFHLFDGKQNFCNVISDTVKQQNKLGMYLNSYRYSSATLDTRLQFTVYPLFWRENVHGESDYMLGIYYWHNDTPNKIKMIDLEDFDIKDAVSYKKNGTSEYVKSSSGNTPYDVTKLAQKDSIAMEGYHFDMDCGAFAEGNLKDYQFGFYIKSGLKPGYTEGKGRNYTHITYQGNMHNGKAWGNDNYWDMPMRDVIYAYSGAVMGNPSTASNARPERADGLVWGYNGDNACMTDGGKRCMVGFMSQPKGNTTKPENVDFSDVVIGISYADLTDSHFINSKGETFGVYPWYLAAEDLGSTDDWDFNDMVVNIYDLTTDFTRPYVSRRGRYPVPSIMGRRITVLPRACGATYPIYLMYEGEVAEDITDETHLSALSQSFTKGTYVVGTEFHAWLGEPDYKKMLNTGLDDGHSGGAISFCIPLMKDGTEEINPSDPPQICSGVNQGIRGFWVLVDKDNSMRDQLENTAFDVRPIEPEYWNSDRTKVFRSISQTENVLKPFSGRLGEGAYRVDPPKESGSLAPQMLMCQYAWKWPMERANIGNTYTSFRDWVAGKQSKWHNPSPGDPGCSHYEDKVCQIEAVKWIQ
ncbi:MAG: hypothetical protein K2L21_04335 [Muribaculaceae bacterium]|nr:hypothetical protein [Muribaculaceae bacterium]